MFILASASPRRRALLRQVGAKFVSIPPSVDEVTDGERPRDAVIHNALIKARKVSEQYPDHAVLGADTVVVLNGTAFGKPRDSADARRMLSLIEGRQHTVLTGIAWVVDGREYTDAAETTVRFAPMTAEEIAAYVAMGEAMGKAGAYAIQGRAAIYIEELHGSFSNVVGLPLHAVATLARTAGVVMEDEDASA